MTKKIIVLLLASFVLLSNPVYAQTDEGEDIKLGRCIQFASIRTSISPTSGSGDTLIEYKADLTWSNSVSQDCKGLKMKFNFYVGNEAIDSYFLYTQGPIPNINNKYSVTVKSSLRQIVDKALDKLDISNGKDLFFIGEFVALNSSDSDISDPDSLRISNVHTAFNLRKPGEFGANLVCAVNVAGTKAIVCNLGSKNDTLISIPKDINCKNGELCDYCNNQYQPFCQDPDNLPDGTVPGCIAIESKDCTDVNRGYYYCSKKTGKCEKESDVKTGDRVGDRQNNPSCSNICSRTSTTEGGGLSTKPSEDISFSYKIPNLLAGKAENLGELIDYVLSAVLKFAIPIAVLFIIFQGVRLLLNPIMDSFGYKPVSEREVFNNIGIILAALAVIFIGRGFVTLIISILNPPS